MTAQTLMTVGDRTVDVTDLSAAQRASLRAYLGVAEDDPRTERVCRKCGTTYTARFGSLCTPCVEAELERDAEREYEAYLDGKEATRA